MNKREENLIRILYEKKNTFVIVEEMAEHENCSDKTIRNSLDKVEDHISKFSSVLELERIRGKGIRLKVKEDSRITLKDILDRDCSNEDILSTDERRFELLYTLLMDTKPVTLKELSKKYYINREVIVDDLNEIGKRLEKYNLKIISKKKVGTFVEGLEKDKREALSQSIKNLDGFDKVKPTLKNIFMSHEIDLVNKAIMDLQDHIEVYFTDESSNALAIHVLFMIKRIKLNQAVSISNDEKNLVKSKLQYSWALKLAGYLEKNFSLTFPKNEITYLAVHLLGMRYSVSNDIELIDFTSGTDSNIMDILLDRLLNNMEQTCKVSFKSDEILIAGLRLHLYGSLNRIKYGLSLENPLFEDIKRMSPYLYYEALDTVDRFNSEYNINIPKEEVAYITVHFQASIERYNNILSKKYSAVVVCHLGIGVSNYLKIKLEKIFSWIDFRDNISVKEIRKYMKYNSVDFIFSTVDIGNLDLKYIKIGPIIDKIEESRIKEAVNNHMVHNELKNETKIHKFIDEKFIFLKKELKNKVEVIELITSKLYELGRVDSKFHKSVFTRELIDSTEIGNFLAIPHGDTNHIIFSTISILTLEEPILWCDEKVQIVFLLAVKKEDYLKDDTMRSFFKYLNNLSNNEESLERLIKENNINNFLKLIK
jgi:activator of the mannose operon (transcriptional antiterminator)